jgi:hypothetical protein
MSAASAKAPEPSASSGESVTLIQGPSVQGMTAPKHGHISVLDTKLAEADKKQYTAYILQYEAADSKEDIAVSKRYSELYDFNEVNAFLTYSLSFF